MRVARLPFGKKSSPFLLDEAWDFIQETDIRWVSNNYRAMLGNTHKPSPGFGLVCSCRLSWIPRCDYSSWSVYHQTSCVELYAVSVWSPGTPDYFWWLGIGWNQAISVVHRRQFWAWVKGLEAVKSWRIPRSYSGVPWREGTQVQLHAFGDTSQVKYAAYVWLYMQLQDSSWSFTLVYS